jgi:glucokinase
MKSGDVVPRGKKGYCDLVSDKALSIGGGVSAEREYLIEPVCRIIDRDQYTRLRKKKTHVTAALLGNDAGIIGAAGLGK